MNKMKKFLLIVISIPLVYYILFLIGLFLFDANNSPLYTESMRKKTAVINEAYQRQNICYECMSGTRKGICPKILSNTDSQKYPNATQYIGEYESVMRDYGNLIYEKVTFQSQPIIQRPDVLIKVEESGNLDKLIIGSTVCETFQSPEFDDHYHKKTTLNETRIESLKQMLISPTLIPFIGKM